MAPVDPESTFRLTLDMAVFVAVVVRRPLARRRSPDAAQASDLRALLFLDATTIDGPMLTAIADHDTLLMKLCP